MRMFLSIKRTSGCLALSLLVGIGSCRDATSPSTSRPTGPSASAALVTCPNSQAKSSSALIGLTGGTITVGGTSVVFPLGALLAASTIELKVPASQYAEIELTVNGQQHAQFSLPVVVTIDYGRCGSDLSQKTLSVWNIDTSTKALIENMGGVDNKLTQTITFTTNHFSGYAVAD